MGVRGLMSYVLRHKDNGTTELIDLVEESSHRGRNGVTLLVDLADFAAWLLPRVDRSVKEYEPDATTTIYGGEYVHYDEVLCMLVFGLRNAGVYLEFFVDTPRGSGLIDSATSVWADEAKRRLASGLDCAKAVRQWCRGERTDLPDRMEESRCSPLLWFDQLRATLGRCGCTVWHLAPEEQAPLLSLGHGSDWGHVWGIVSDNIDWAVVRGLKLVPFSCFDLEGDLGPWSSEGSEVILGWPEVSGLKVRFTSADLLAEHLRLGHPPREDDMQQHSAKGKGRGPVGYGRWPFKWWNDQVLVELAMLCGTDATTPLIQKHKLYAQLGLQVGADPVDSISRWLRNQLYSNKLRWRDLHVEALSPVLTDLASKDQEFALALKISRSVYVQRPGEVKSIQAELARLKRESSDKMVAIFNSEQHDLPDACSLAVRSAAYASRVYLDVTFEDVSRNGAPLAHQLLADIRRILYLLLRRTSVHEHGVAGEQRSSVQRTLIDLEPAAGTIPALQAIQRWPFLQRWVFFRKLVEHNALQSEAQADVRAGAGGDVPAGDDGRGNRQQQEQHQLGVETVVWDAYKAARDSATKPPRLEFGFLGAVMEYFVSLNLRSEQPLIREHEFDSILVMLALCCDASLPGSMLEDAPEHIQHRLAEVKVHLCQIVAGAFHVQSEVRVPLRVSVLASWFQASCTHLLDAARLFYLDVDATGSDGDGAAYDPLFLPEPRELFCGQLLAALYIGGAYGEWEVRVPEGESQFYWKGLYKQLMQLRWEVIQTQCFQGWRRRFMNGLRRGTLSWPTREQLAADSKKHAQGSDELPIDEHREKILNHIGNHRVTCIQGETGCGKSTRVPVYVMEDYFERKKAGKIKDSDTFMVLCTQPRRIACISLANRVASCIGERLGGTIGYKISGDSCVRPGHTKLVYVTTGYLLQVLVNNPEAIRGYSHLILDEVHERDVDSDLLSLVVKLQMSGYNFKLVIMSATLQGDLFTRYFSDKKIKTIFVGVKRFPVEILHIEQLWDRYGGSCSYDWGDQRRTEGTRGLQAPFASQAIRAIRDAERCFGTGGYEAEGLEDDDKPTRGEFDDSSSEESEASEDSEDAAAALAKAMAAPPKRRRKEVAANILRGLDYLVYEVICRVANPGEGILVFLPGIGEISELQESLLPLEDPEREAQLNWRPSCPRHDLRFKVFVLHSLIPKDEQEGAVFDAPPADCCHVILSSNIAESSLTIPKVRVVIDFGLRRQLVYDKRRHMSCLVTTWVSQASAKQRIGRTGRVFEGVAIRLFTKQFYDGYMDEFDPPEMQTAPLEKLYVNVKHLSGKLPEYQISPTEKRKRTPKELLLLTAQPPDMASIDSSIEVLDQLGAITKRSEDAELTVLGYLMMSVPLDVHLCRLVIFGALLGCPCEGIVAASALSVQDPFTLPSHLIIKDPREYAEALKRSYVARVYFDHGHCSEPLMLRNLFVHWLTDFRKMLVERCGRKGGYRRENTRSTFLRCSQGIAQKFACVPKRLVHLANSVLDTTQRMRKFIPTESPVLKQVDSLVALLQAGDRWFESVQDAEAGLPKVEDLFCTDAWKLKALLVMSFTPSFMAGSTKVRGEDPMMQAIEKSWKKKKKEPKKEKNKMELLLDEIIEQGLAPEKTVACVLELPRGRGVNRWSNRFVEDLKATLDMITCGEPFSLTMVGENKAFVTFEEQTSSPESLFGKLDFGPVATLNEEEALVKDLPLGAHLIDLYGAGRWKFSVPMLNSWKIEQEKAEKERKEREAREEREKAAAERAERLEKAAALKKARQEEAERKKEEARAKKAGKTEEKVEDKAKDKAEDKPDAKAEEKSEEKAADKAAAKTEDKVADKTEDKAEDKGEEKGAEKAEDKADNKEPNKASEEEAADAAAAPADAAAEDGEAPKAEEAAKDGAEEVAKADSADAGGDGEDEKKGADDKESEKKDKQENEQGEDTSPQDGGDKDAEAEADAEDQVEDEADANKPIDPAAAIAAAQEAAAAKAAEKADGPEELGPIIGIYKPVSPYEVGWELMDQAQDEVAMINSRKGVRTKSVKKKVMKGRCSWRNPAGFLGSCRLSPEGGLEPWPNDVFAVYTATQGGDSKELAWVDGVTQLSAEGGNLLAFVLLVTFLRPHQELSFDVDLQCGRVFAIRGPGGLEFYPRDDQNLLVEDMEHINDLRMAISESFYTSAPPVPTTVEAEDGIDFTGSRGRRDAEPVPQIAKEPRVAVALEKLMAVLREATDRHNSMDEVTWNDRLILHKPLIRTFDMHGPAATSGGSASSSSDGGFRLFRPLTDLAQAKADAERQQQEEEERRRRQEEERRRKKDEERIRREEEKRQKKAEDHRRKQEEKLMKKGGKGEKGKGKAEQLEGKGKGGKGKGKEVSLVQQLQVPPPTQLLQQQQQQLQQQGAGGRRERQQQQQQQQQGNSRKGRKAGREEAAPATGPMASGSTQSFQYGVGYQMPDLPPPWVAVPDHSTGRFYYWNQVTNEVSWTPPNQQGDLAGGQDFGQQQQQAQDQQSGHIGGFGFGVPQFPMHYPFASGANRPWQ